MNRRKCEIIAVTEYEHLPPVAFENDGHKYHKSDKGRYLKATRKTCNMCASPAVYVAIFKYPRHNRVERFCKEHAAQFTNAKELPLLQKSLLRINKNIILIMRI
jgi:hypothetical protein